MIIVSAAATEQSHLLPDANARRWSFSQQIRVVVEVAVPADGNGARFEAMRRAPTHVLRMLSQSHRRPPPSSTSSSLLLLLLLLLCAT
jgi:hypothetical protein